EGVGIADAEDDQRRQPHRIGLQRRGIDALARELLAHEAAHMLVADAAEEGGAKPEAGAADGGVRGTPADIFGEAPHVLQPPAPLLAVEVDGDATDGDEVEARLGHIYPAVFGRQNEALGSWVQRCSAVNSGTV